MILSSIYVGRNRNRNRKESELFFTDSDSKPWIPITLLAVTGEFVTYLLVFKAHLYTGVLVGIGDMNNYSLKYVFKSIA